MYGANDLLNPALSACARNLLETLAVIGRLQCRHQILWSSEFLLTCEVCIMLCLKLHIVRDNVTVPLSDSLPVLSNTARIAAGFNDNLGGVVIGAVITCGKKWNWSRTIVLLWFLGL